jgi:spore germination protein GerM
MLGFSLYFAVPSTAQKQSTAAVTKTDSRSPKTQKVKVYFLSPKNHKLVPVLRASFLPQTNTPEEFLKTALKNLLAQPQQKTLISAIPTGTKLVDLKIKGDRIYVNLSSEFAREGGAYSLVGRVGQIVYTVTSLNPQAQVFLSVDGQLIDDQHPLGTTGLELRQPMTRKEYMTEFATSFKR